MNHSIDIWIVIVTFNAKKWIDECLKSVNESTIKANVIVVDNCSTDGTIAILKDKFLQVNTIINQKNEGFGVANNIGISHALKNGADYIVLLNQDAKLNNDTLEKLYQYAQQYPKYGILSPMFYSYNGDRLDLYLLRWVFSYNLELASDIFFKRPKDVYDINLAPAATWFMRREALIEAGGFDPLFFMYGEDGDLWGRFRAKGWKAGLFPKTFVYHHTPENNYTIQKRIWHGYAANINALKNINRSYLQNIFFLFKDYFKSILNTILDLNKSELYVIHVSYFKTFTRLKSIYQNRKISHRDKMPFLSRINT